MFKYSDRSSSYEISMALKNFGLLLIIFYDYCISLFHSFTLFKAMLQKCYSILYKYFIFFAMFTCFMKISTLYCSTKLLMGDFFRSFLENQFISWKFKYKIDLTWVIWMNLFYFYFTLAIYWALFLCNIFLIFYFLVRNGSK